MGIQLSAMAMMKVALAFVAIVVVAHANVEHEAANERGEIEYRLSFKTKDVEKAAPAPHSTGKFSVEIIGKDGTTGPQDLIDHPSMVKISGDNQDKWHPSWVKVNSNDFHSGQGHGIYYASVPTAIKKDQPFTASSEVDPEEESHLHKCMASFCNKAEHRYLQEGDDEPAEHEHDGHFGPLGEGMPGTEKDPSMTRGHFMREFFAMQHVDEDDEDFLRTHSV